MSYQRSEIIFLVCVVLTAALAAAWIAQAVFDFFPNSADEYAYLFQAQTYLQGRLWNPEHPLREFFETYHIIHGDGKNFSKYPPVWPLTLSAGMLLKLPAWAVNPLIGAGSLVLVYSAARYRYGRYAAVIAVLALLFCPFFLFNSASYFSHTVCSFLILGFCVFMLRYERGFKIQNAVAAGVMLGLAFQTRYFTAALAGMAFLMYCLALRPEGWRKGFLGITIGFLPLFFSFLVYNQVMTGNPLLTPFQFYDQYDRIGFFKDWPYPHTFLRGMTETGIKWSYLSRWTGYAVGYLYLFALAGLVFKKKWHFSDLFFLTLIVGHAFHWASGTNQYGPRYYYEGFPFAVMTVAGFFFGKDGSFFQGRTGRVLRIAGAAFFFAGVILAALKIPTNATIVKSNVQHRQDPYHQAGKQGLENAVVLIQDSGTEPGRQTRDAEGLIREMPRRDFLRNDVDFKNEVLYALDLGQANIKLMRYYKDRKFYFYSRDEGLFARGATSLPAGREKRIVQSSQIRVQG